LELGAGTAAKTQVLLRALVRRQGRTRYFPADLSASALAAAAATLSREVPEVDVTPLVATHAEALAMTRQLDLPVVVLFLGSSIGNYGEAESAALLGDIGNTAGAHGALLLGTDLCKPLDVLLPAYDDAAGVTAEFNKNVLARINRELAGNFDLQGFRHTVLWNDADSSIEMHLESVAEQQVNIRGLGMNVSFAPGERIHTESSHKYDDRRIDELLGKAAIKRTRTLTDPRRWFALHVARLDGRAC
jgi:dimethylhistidine N-methyltransferase